MMATGRLTAVETTAGDGGLRVFLETSGKVDAQSFVPQQMRQRKDAKPAANL